MPKRSASRPIAIPPIANPIMVSVYGSEASARATPNSASTAGRVTTTDHSPTPPIMLISSDIVSRYQAYGLSTSAAVPVAARSTVVTMACPSEECGRPEPDALRAGIRQRAAHVIDAVASRQQERHPASARAGRARLTLW